MRKWVLWPCRLLTRWFFAGYHRTRVVGARAVPRTGAVLFVANHASFLDPPLVGCTAGRDVWHLARASLGKSSAFRWLLDSVGVRFVDRAGSARAGIAAAIEELRAGRALCMFPEGTRTPTGKVAAFRPGALLVLRRAPCTVVPVGVRGTFAAWPRTRKLPRPRRVSVHFGEPMSPAVVLADGGYEELRRRVATLANAPLESDVACVTSDSGPAVTTDDGFCHAHPVQPASATDSRSPAGPTSTVSPH